MCNTLVLLKKYCDTCLIYVSGTSSIFLETDLKIVNLTFVSLTVIPVSFIVFNVDDIGHVINSSLDVGHRVIDCRVVYD